MPRKALAETDTNAIVASPAKTTNEKGNPEKKTLDKPSRKRKSTANSDAETEAPSRRDSFDALWERKLARDPSYKAIVEKWKESGIDFYKRAKESESIRNCLKATFQLEEEEDKEEDDDDDDLPSWFNRAAHPFGYDISDNCDQVRRKITAFLSSGEMKVGEFQSLIDVSAHSYQLFMRQRGSWKGKNSITYMHAACFFKEREEQGLPPPKKKRVTTKKTKNGKEATEEKDKYDVSDIHLDGESEFAVPVYDTCDVVRRKIRHHLRQAGVTQASFLRHILAAAYQPWDPKKKIQSKQLNDFLSYDGSVTGNASAVFYAAYVFFEKLRIRDGKPKDEFRLEMEKVWGRNGFDREPSNKKYYFAMAGTVVFWNKYGKTEVARGRR